LSSILQLILRSDARQLADTLTRDLVYPLVVLNAGGVDGLRRCPRWTFDLGEAEDVAGVTAADVALPTLSADADPQIDAWIDTLQTMLDASTSLEEFRAHLIARYDSLPPDTLITVLRDAFAALDLAGRSDVQDEIGGNRRG
jgi:phage gp29-like protein